MGFFSSLCHGCEVSLRSIYATRDLDEIESVAIKEDGSILMGRYDGYGRFDTPEGGQYEDVLDNATVWHKACWIKAGCPSGFVGESAHAPDQGYFFDDEEEDDG